jgi:hypothetical protein
VIFTSSKEDKNLLLVRISAYLDNSSKHCVQCIRSIKKKVDFIRNSLADGYPAINRGKIPWI